MTTLPVALLSADAGTPLMWMGFFHLVFGNFLIALLEAGVVAKHYRLRFLKCFGLFILANYFSMFIGLIIVGGGLRVWVDSGPFGVPPLFAVPWFLGIATVLFWALTVVLESPFCHSMLPPERRTWGKAMRVSLLAQSVSYAVLVVAYLSVSQMGLYSQTHLRHKLDFVREPIAWVYYINPSDGAVWRIRTNGENRHRVMETHLDDIDARLVVRKNAGGGSWDLLAVGGDRGSSPTLLIPRFAALSARAERAGRVGRHEMENIWSGFGPPADLRPENRRKEEVRVSPWSADGITMDKGDKRIFISLETPFVHWRSRNATILPSDQMVYQLGDQIVILDLDTRALGFLTMGRGPVVAFDKMPKMDSEKVAPASFSRVAAGS